LKKRVLFSASEGRVGARLRRALEGRGRAIKRLDLRAGDADTRGDIHDPQRLAGQRDEVARPTLFERKIFRIHPHFDPRFDRSEPIERRGPGCRFRFRELPRDGATGSPRRPTDILGTHSFPFRRVIFARIERAHYLACRPLALLPEPLWAPAQRELHR
jgi:hypothetical protein